MSNKPAPSAEAVRLFENVTAMLMRATTCHEDVKDVRWDEYEALRGVLFAYIGRVERERDVLRTGTPEMRAEQRAVMDALGACGMADAVSAVRELQRERDGALTRALLNDLRGAG